jgi:hypothetical protein
LETATFSSTEARDETPKTERGEGEEQIYAPGPITVQTSIDEHRTPEVHYRDAQQNVRIARSRWKQ